MLDLDPAAIDAVRFERLAEEARLAVEDDPAGAAGTAREALALWRGRPYGDLTDDEYFTLESHRLEELRLAVLETALEADLARGALASATAQLESAVEEQPYRERLLVPARRRPGHGGTPGRGAPSGRPAAAVAGDHGPGPVGRALPAGTGHPRRLTARRLMRGPQEDRSRACATAAAGEPRNGSPWPGSTTSAARSASSSSDRSAPAWSWLKARCSKRGPVSRVSTS